MGKVFQCQRTRLASSMTPDMHFQVSVSIFKYVTNDKSSLENATQMHFIDFFGTWIELAGVEVQLLFLGASNMGIFRFQFPLAGRFRREAPTRRTSPGMLASRRGQELHLLVGVAVSFGFWGNDCTLETQMALDRKLANGG